MAKVAVVLIELARLIAHRQLTIGTDRRPQHWWLWLIGFDHGAHQGLLLTFITLLSVGLKLLKSAPHYIAKCGSSGTGIRTRVAVVGKRDCQLSLSDGHSVINLFLAGAFPVAGSA
jgi:hypothetical protein